MSPFEGIQKNAVLQEVKVFCQMPLQPRQCCLVLSKILYLINHGERFSAEENTQIFFSTTRLFQNADVCYVALCVCVCVCV